MTHWEFLYWEFLFLASLIVVLGGAQLFFMSTRSGGNGLGKLAGGCFLTVVMIAVWIVIAAGIASALYVALPGTALP